MHRGIGECEHNCQDKQKAFNLELRPVTEEVFSEFHNLDILMLVLYCSFLI